MDEGEADDTIVPTLEVRPRISKRQAAFFAVHHLQRRLRQR